VSTAATIRVGPENVNRRRSRRGCWPDLNFCK